MAIKLVTFQIGNGSLANGFPDVRLSIGDERKLPDIVVTGQLPANNKIMDLYKDWQKSYQCLTQNFRKIVVEQEITTNISWEETSENLKTVLNDWVNSNSFQSIKNTLFANLSPSDEIRFLIETKSIELQKLPWHLWNFFNYYEKSEIAFSISEYKKCERDNFNKSITPVKILSILGESRNLDLEKDQILLKNLPDTEIVTLKEPTRKELSDHLWNQSFDIIFFAGHGWTEPKNEIGVISINSNECLTIDELKFALKKAVENGLSLTIFNCCDGLGLANDLAELDIPQTIVMRESISDEAAHEFLKYFLKFFTSGQSLYISVRRARQKLQEIEDRFPGVSWLPIIFQHPTYVPPTWSKLRGSKMTKCPKCGENSLEEIKANVFKCVSCKHHQDLNDPRGLSPLSRLNMSEFGWIIPVLTAVWSKLRGKKELDKLTGKKELDNFTVIANQGRVMSNSKMARCPKCGEKSFKEIKANVFKCVSCDHRKDLNDPEFGVMPAITVGSLTGLMIAIVGFLFINRAAPNNFSTPTRNQIVTASISNFDETPAQTEPKAISKPIPQAISGNQVLLEISGKSQVVLLCGLNAPAPNSQLFAAATQNLQQLLDRTGKDNLMYTAISNTNGTSIVELYDLRSQVSINAQQVANGYASSSQVLAEPCRDRVQILANVKQAQEQQKGIWKP